MLILVMVILVALLTGALIMLRLQTTDTRAASMANAKRRALYCAEAGLERGRTVIGQNYPDWGAILDTDPGNNPTYYSSGALFGDIDGDGVMDFSVTVKDNDDEFPTADPNADNDLQVFIESECLKYPDIQLKLLALIGQESATGNIYKGQKGAGATNANNDNAN